MIRSVHVVGNVDPENGLQSCVLCGQALIAIVETCPFAPGTPIVQDSTIWRACSGQSITPDHLAGLRSDAPQYRYCTPLQPGVVLNPAPPSQAHVANERVAAVLDAAGALVTALLRIPDQPQG